MYSNDLERPILFLSNFLKIVAISVAIVLLPYFGLTAMVSADAITDNPAANRTTTQIDPVSVQQTQPVPEADQNIVSPAEQPTITASSPSGETPVLNDIVAIGITNELNSSAVSGNTKALNNASVGTVSTGDANVSTTNLNLVNSSLGLQNGSQPVTFNYQITGNVSGDLLIDPSQLATASVIPTSDLSLSPISVGSDTNTTIINNLALTAISGDVIASNNLSIADVLTGNASAVANVVNIINSAINANKSFIGTINIFGNFEGNIILPQDLISGMPGSSQSSPYQLLGNVSESNIDQNLSIINNVNSVAQSGSATVSGNTQTGNVTSGASKTNVILQNLANFGVTSKNMLLVFINFLGNWLGLLFDTPADGTTSASLNSSSEPNSSSDGGLNGPVSLPYNYLSGHTKTTIINNVNLVAQSGNAIVSDNLKTGDIGTGNATTSANIINIISSRLNLSNWFGVLFINVFGKWHGNLTFASLDTNQAPDSSSTNQSINENSMQTFNFIANNNARRHDQQTSSAIISSSAEPTSTSSGTKIHAVSKNILSAIKDTQDSSRSIFSFWLIISLVTISGAFGARYYLAPRFSNLI